MSTIITKNSANSGSIPASLVQGELAINVTDGRLFYGSGSGNVVKEFTGSASGGTIDTGSFATTGSNTFTGDQIINGENLGLIVDASGLKRVGFMKYGGLEGSIARVANQNFRILRTTGSNINDGTDAITDFYIAGDGKVGIGTTSPAYTLDVSGSSNFTDGQTIVGNITFPSGSFISSTNISGNIYISTLNDGILHLNDDGGEGDVWMLNGQNKLRIEGDTIITGSIHQSGTFYPNQIDWFSSSIGYDTGSYILTTTANGLTTYANYQDVASTLTPYISTVSSSISASYALNGGVTQLLAGSNITLSPTNGKGQVTITSTGGGPNFNTATGSYGSFYDTTTQTNPVASIPRSMSFNTTDISNGVSISGSTSPYNTYIKTANAGVYNIQFSAQFDRTNSGTDIVYIWLRKNGIDIVETNTSIVLTGTAAANPLVAAWNWFTNSAAGDYYQIMWASGDTHVRLLADSTPTYGPTLPSIILTVNRVDQFLSNTGSFTGSFTGALTGTASYASQTLSSSYATTSSYVQTAQTASYVLQAVSASFATFAQTANTASYVQTAQTASYVLQAVSASYATTALSSSYAATSSFINPLNQQVVVTGSLRGQVSALTITGGAASVNLSTNNFFTLGLVNGANTVITPTNVNPGQTVNILITQGTLGTGTVSFPGLVKQPSGSLYTGSAVANAVDIVTMIAFDSTNVYVSSVRNMI